MNNEGFILLNFYALIIMCILCAIFFGKKRMHKLEDNTYGKLLIASVVTIFFGLLLGIFFDLDIAYKTLSIIVFNKIYLNGLVITISIFAFYTFCISRSNSKHFSLFEKIYKLFIFLNFVIISFLPLEVSNVGNKVVTSGLSMNYTYLVFGCIYLILFGLIITDLKNIKNKKYIPIILIMMEGIIIVLIQIFFPQMNYIINPSTVITCLVMYFTIENPDVKMLNQLELAKNTAEKANMAKSDFLSSMSHEIRTPLNAIVGLSEIIKTSDNIEEIHEDADDVVTAANNLLEIVNGILDISKIEANKMEIVETKYNPVEIFNELTTLVKTRIGEKEIELRCNFAPDIPTTLYGDKGKVKQIITNLLTNAAKYTEKGYIDFNVSCVNEKDECRLSIVVKDTGRGIKQEKMKTLFNKFERLEEDRNTTIEGTGLGLAITKSLVDMMGGKVVVSSIYGNGSTFTIYIKQKIVDSNIFKAEKIEIKEQKNTTYEGKKILVVDDNKLNIKVAIKKLKEYAVLVDSVESGFECIDKINNNEYYDLILMDIMMPKMGGVETLKRLKQINNFNIPVIALTADAMEGKSNKYLEVGFDGYLSKPIENDKLSNVLNKYLSDKKADKKTEDKQIIHSVEKENYDINKVIPITDEQIEQLNKLVENNPKILDNNIEDL